jgi:hypothetical protein
MLVQLVDAADPVELDGQDALRRAGYVDRRLELSRDGRPFGGIVGLGLLSSRASTNQGRRAALGQPRPLHPGSDQARRRRRAEMAARRR